MSKPDLEPAPDPKPAQKPDTGRKPGPTGGNRNGALAGLIIAAVILGVGLWLARDLTAASKMQDCLMSGRTNCNVIVPAR